MLVGLTYDLRSEYLREGYSEEETAEFDRSDTIDALESALLALGHEVDRIGRGKSLVGRLAKGDVWDLVFNICEGLHGLSREAQVPAVLDLYEIPYTFGDALVMSVCLHKQQAKTIAATSSPTTPKTRLSTSPTSVSHSVQASRYPPQRIAVFCRAASVANQVL